MLQTSNLKGPHIAFGIFIKKQSCFVYLFVKSKKSGESYIK